MNEIEHLLIKFQQIIDTKEQLQNKNRMIINNTHSDGYRYLKENGFIMTTPVSCDYTYIRIDRLKHIQRIISAVYVTAEICEEYQDKIIEILKHLTCSNTEENLTDGVYILVTDLKLMIDEYYTKNKNIGCRLKPYPEHDIMECDV